MEERKPSTHQLILLTFLYISLLPLVSHCAPYNCPAESDFTGETPKDRPWVQWRDSSHQPVLTPPTKIERKFASQLAGQHKCPSGLTGSRVSVRNFKYYELTNFCIRPMFLGGLTLYQPRTEAGEEIPLEDGGLEVCNEFHCAPYPVTVTKKNFPCSKARWIKDASALVVPFTNGNPWHFLHHLIPLTQVLEDNQASFLNSHVHLYTTLASRPNSAPPSPHRRRARRWHPFPARTYFSTWRFKWWPLLGASLPPGLSMTQVDHLELLRDDPEFSDPRESATVCYRHGFLGLPLLFRHDTAVHPKPLVPAQHVRSFRERALALVGAQGIERPSRCQTRGLFGSSGSSPLMGLIVRRGTRKLCNLNGIAEAASKVGFRVELVSFEEMDVFGQLQAATRFDFLVGVHGAGMTNVFWLRPGAVALEMYPALPNEPLAEGENVNPGSNYGRFAAVASTTHIVWLQKLLGIDVSDVPFRTIDLSMDIADFKKIAGRAYETWYSRFCI